MSTTPKPAADGGVRERDLLADAIAQAGIKCGLLRPDIEGLTGPQLLMVCDDMATALSSHRQAGDRRPLGYTALFNAIAAATWPATEGVAINVSVAKFHESIGGNVYTAPPPCADRLRDAAAAFLEAADARDNEETSTQYPEHERRLRQYKAARADLESLLALVEKGAGS